MLIGICGKKGVGKDTVADFLVRDYGFQKDAFAAPIKTACSDIFSIPLPSFYEEHQKETIDPFWGKTPRQLLQIVGTDMFRDHMDPDIWIKSLGRRCDQKSGTNICVSDVRFKNEAQCILDRGGLLLYIDRSTAPQGDSHKSETLVEEIRLFPHVGIVVNEGSIEDLYDQVRAFMKDYERL